MDNSRHYVCYSCSDCMSVAETYCSVLIDPTKLQQECLSLDGSKFYDVFNSYCRRCDDLRMQVPKNESKLNQLSYLMRKVHILKCCKVLTLVEDTTP